MELIRALWRGDISLARTFWLFFFCGNALLNIALIPINLSSFRFTPIGWVIFTLLVMIITIYFPFTLIATWRSANKYQGLQRNAILAKLAVIMGWVKYVGLLVLFGQAFA